MKVNELFEESKGRTLADWLTDHDFIDADTWMGGLDCSKSKLTSLDGGQQLKKVTGFFGCGNNELTTLKGAPEIVKDYYYCSLNKLTSLEGAPKVMNNNFRATENRLTSLHNIHKVFESIDGHLFLGGNPIKECVLGLLKIKKLKSVDIDNGRVKDILMKYIPEGNIVECQSELIEAGFEEYAKL
jgi:hypothetical protein